MTTIQMESYVETKDEVKKKKELWGWIRFVLILAFVFFMLRYGISISIISGGSMESTYHDGSIVLTNNLYFEPEFQDIVIFTDTNGFDVIKRVVGTPGDTVEIKDGVVLINGNALEESYTLGIPDDMPIQTISDDSYFLIGDHRTPGKSYDSRSDEIGAVSEELIKGEVMVSLNPFGFGE